MKTTLKLSDPLRLAAKATAAQQRTTLTRLIEEGLPLRLCAKPALTTRGMPDIPVFDGGGRMLSGIDRCSNKSMLAALAQAAFGIDDGVAGVDLANAVDQQHRHDAWHLQPLWRT